MEYQLDLNGDGVYQWWQTRGMLETSTLNDAPYKYMFGMTICIDAHKQAELTLLKNKEELKKLILVQIWDLQVLFLAYQPSILQTKI